MSEWPDACNTLNHTWNWWSMKASHFSCKQAVVKLKVYSAARTWRSSADVRKPHCILSAFWHLETNSIHSPRRVQMQEKTHDFLGRSRSAIFWWSWLRARLNVQPQYCFIAQLCSQTGCNQCLVADEIEIEPELWGNPLKIRLHWARAKENAFPEHWKVGLNAC